MIKKVAGIAILLLACASASVQAADSCEVVLCMFGKLTGQSGGSESSAAERMFSTSRYGKKGSSKPAPPVVRADPFSRNAPRTRSNKK